MAVKNQNLIAKCAFFAAGILSVCWGFQAMFGHAAGVFRVPEEDLSYGWFVPVFSLFVMWRERRQIVAAAQARSGWGSRLAAFALLLFFLLLGFIGVRGTQLRFEIVAFAGILWTLTWLFWGWRTAKAVVFPCWFLLFCIPLNSFLDVVTVHLRLFATSAAFAVMKGLGADIVRQGTMIAGADGSFAIDVAAPCSGLRSIFALMALTAAYGYFAQRKWWRWAILFACSVPLAVLGNVCRIFTIVATANWCSAEFATGFYHDYSGYVVFLVALGCMLGVNSLIDRIWGESNDGDELQPEEAGVRGRELVPLFCVTAMVAALMVFQAKTPVPELMAAPEVVLGELPGFDSRAMDPSEAEIANLPPDTRFVKRLYTDRNSGEWYLVTCVIGGSSKRSIHRPELCLPSQGFQMVRPRNADIAGREWRMMDIERGYGLPLGFAYTFFNQEGFATSSHARRIWRDVLDRSLFNRYDRWVMVTVNGCRAYEPAMKRFLSQLEETLWKQ